MPSRLGFTLTPTFINVVLVAPSCSIIGQFPEAVRVFRMDSMTREIRKEDPGMLSMLKFVSQETLQEIGAKLAAEHKPSARSGTRVMEEPVRTRPVAVSKPIAKSDDICNGCGGPITKGEASFCRSNSARFGGKLICRKCQELTPKSAIPESAAARCAECAAPVDSKVVNYCRIKSREFGKRILCRKCQQLVPA